jgi:putative ABC transport system permease protein
MLVLAIGLGVGATMTMTTVVHVLSRDPLPGRSASLFYTQIDSRPDDWHGDGPDPNLNLTWIDASNLLKAGRAARQAAMAGGQLLVGTNDSTALPRLESGHYVTPDFFAMFGVPLIAGRAWGASEEAGAARVVVINVELSRTLFGNASSIGKPVRIQDADFIVVGVTDRWEPRPRFYNDTGSRAFSDKDNFFIPLNTAVDLKFDSTANRVCWGSDQTHTLTSDYCTWLQFWVQLRPEQVQPYERFLVNYQHMQRDAGRFGTKGSARLYKLTSWLKRQDLVPRDVWMQLALAASFFAVCLINIVSLLLTKFMGRSQEVGIRRSLGAQRRDVFLQFTTEASLIGAMGGVLGIVFTQLGLAVVRSRPDGYAKLAHTDMPMLLATLALAVLGSVLAGTLPAWRASSIAPALHLKES